MCTTYRFALRRANKALGHGLLGRRLLGRGYATTRSHLARVLCTDSIHPCAKDILESRGHSLDVMENLVRNNFGIVLDIFEHLLGTFYIDFEFVLSIFLVCCLGVGA